MSCLLPREGNPATVPERMGRSEPRMCGVCGGINRARSLSRRCASVIHGCRDHPACARQQDVDYRWSVRGNQRTTGRVLYAGSPGYERGHPLGGENSTGALRMCGDSPCTGINGTGQQPLIAKEAEHNSLGKEMFMSNETGTVRLHRVLSAPVERVYKA